MKGYIKNKTIGWRHALKRSIGPHQKVSLDELYEQYNKKHDIEEGHPFVDWLRNVKLPDHNVWEIVYDDESQSKLNEIQTVELVEEKARTVSGDDVRPFVKKERTIDDVISMSVRQARDELKKLTDVNLLKQALSQANQLAGKDTLCRMIRKRVQELELSRR